MSEQQAVPWGFIERLLDSNDTKFDLLREQVETQRNEAVDREKRIEQMAADREKRIENALFLSEQRTEAALTKSEARTDVRLRESEGRQLAAITDLREWLEKRDKEEKDNAAKRDEALLKLFEGKIKQAVARSRDEAKPGVHDNLIKLAHWALIVAFAAIAAGGGRLDVLQQMLPGMPGS